MLGSYSQVFTVFGHQGQIDFPVGQASFHAH